MPLLQCIRKIRFGNKAAYLALPLFFLTSCYFHKAPCPAYVDADYIQHGTYDYNAPIECSTWYEDPYGWMWVTESKAQALIKWTEISARPMDFNIDGEFRYSVKAADDYQYYFWSLRGSYNPQFQDTVVYQYVISVYKSPDDVMSVGL